MDTDLQRAASLIGPNATLALHDVAGHTILAVSGRLWLTQHGDSRDVFLEPGQQFTVERQGDTVAQALGAGAAVILVEPPATRREAAAAKDLAAAVDAHAARLVRERGADALAAGISLERVEREARRLRSEAIRYLFGQAAAALERGWKRLLARPGQERTAGCAS
jgi:hypothetical protein